MDALTLGVSFPKETREDCVAYGWHADWTICTATRTATHRSGLSYVFTPWNRCVADALPDRCSWPNRQWVATLRHIGRNSVGEVTALRRCLEACQLFSEDGRFLCYDCNVDTSYSGDYYMVHDALWKQAMPNEYGMLCMRCLEHRIGRKLCSDDFTDCNANHVSQKVQHIRAVAPTCHQHGRMVVVNEHTSVLEVTPWLHGA